MSGISRSMAITLALLHNQHNMTGSQRRWWRKYNRYLNSRDWQRTRKAALKRDRYRCQKCGTRGDRRNPLQANHLSYKAYNATGRTPLGDLETLCRRCHQKVTGRRFKKRRGGNQFLRWVIITAIALLIYALTHHR
jgi:5-methylcytosine-specific restriction endonuclease McrA